MRRYLKVAVSLGVIGIIFVLVLPNFADLSEVWAAITELTWLETITLAGASLWNLFTYWLLLVVVVPGLSIFRAMLITQTSTAVSNILPGGAAVGMGISYSMYKSWGFPRSVVALALVVSGLGDLFAKLLMPALALVVLTIQGRSDPALVSAAIFSSVILIVLVGGFAAGLANESSARRVGAWAERPAGAVARLFRRPPVSGWGEGLARFRAETTERLNENWAKVAGAALLSHFSLYLVLLLTLRHVGVDEASVGWGEVLAAFAFVRLLSAVPITPGGLGVIELGLSAALVVAGGDKELVVAAVLVFRALTFLIQIPLGGLAYVYWKASQREALKPLAP